MSSMRAGTAQKSVPLADRSQSEELVQELRTERHTRF
jgi:hypothetical protein